MADQFYNLNGHQIAVGEFKGSKVVTLNNETQWNPQKVTMGVTKAKVVLETLPALVQFVLTEDPNYKLPTGIEYLRDGNGHVQAVKIVKKGGQQ